MCLGYNIPDPVLSGGLQLCIYMSNGMLTCAAQMHPVLAAHNNLTKVQTGLPTEMGSIFRNSTEGQEKRNKNETNHLMLESKLCNLSEIKKSVLKEAIVKL